MQALFAAHESSVLPSRSAATWAMPEAR
jgi:hypothetical protein